MRMGRLSPGPTRRVARSRVRLAGIVVVLLARTGARQPDPARATAVPPRRPVASPADTLLDPAVLRNLSQLRGTVEVSLTASVVRTALRPGCADRGVRVQRQRARTDSGRQRGRPGRRSLSQRTSSARTIPFTCTASSSRSLNVRAHGTVRVIVRYDDFPGLWMYHCHILDHEEHGMMGVLEVRSPRRRKGS